VGALLCPAPADGPGRRLLQGDRRLPAYLCGWTAFEPAERLLRAWRLAEPLIALHQAVSYRSIVATHEPMDRHMMGSTADWLRKVIAVLRPPAEAGVPPGGGGEA
jgi:hypothetical protein